MIVGEPKRTHSAERDAPGIEQIRIGPISQAADVRNQVVLQVRRRRAEHNGDAPKQTVVFEGAARRDPGSEIERVRVAPTHAVPELQSPQPLNRDGRSICVRQRTHQRATGRIERIDRSVSEIADQQVSGKPAKTSRRQRQAPRRIERAIGGKSFHQVAARVENVHVTVARSGHIVVLVRVLLRVGHPKIRADAFNAERRKTGRDSRVGE